MERLDTSTMADALRDALSWAATLGGELDPAHRFWQSQVANRPGERQIVATIHPEVTLSDVQALAGLCQQLTERIGLFSRMHFTTPDNVSPLTEDSKSERIPFAVSNLPASPIRRSRGHPPGSPGQGLAHATSAEIGSANSTPT